MNKPDWNIGYTTRKHLCIDLDNTSFHKVYLLVKMIMQNYPYVGDCIILQSSTKQQLNKWQIQPNGKHNKTTTRDNYHIVFNNFIGYEKCCHIIETLAYLGVINEEYIRIREMRNDMTLRVSQTVCVEYVKPKPVFILHVENYQCKQQDTGIYLYNKLRKLC